MLKAQKMRSFLTMLGIIIGVASVIAVMAVGASAQKLLLSQVEALGSNLITVLPGGGEEKGPPAALLGIEVTTLKYEDAQAIAKSPNIVAVCSYVSGRGTVSYANKSKEYDFSGVTSDYIRVEDTEVAQGRFLKEREVNSLARVAVLGSKVAEEFFEKDSPLGKKIKINQVIFTVIGVMKQRGTVLFVNQDEQIFIPLTTAQKLMLGIDHLTLLRAKVDKQENVLPAVTRVKETLRFRHHIKNASKDDFLVRNTVQALDILNTISQALKIFLALIAAISLIVGGVGIMNIMFVAVNERVKEIGLRKALGATQRNILFQFLVEAVILTLIGGLLGILTGVIIAFLVSFGVNHYGYEWKFIITPDSVFVSVLTAIIIGLIFGIWPAYRAAKLTPVEALRK